MTYDGWYDKHIERYRAEPILVFSYETTDIEWMLKASDEQKAMTVVEWAKQHMDDPFWADLIALVVTARIGADT